MKELNNFSWEKIIFRLSIIFCIISFLCFIGLFVSYTFERDQQIEKAKNKSQIETIRAAEQIDTTMGYLKQTAQDIANELSSGKLQKENLITKLERTIEENPSFYQVGAAYVPYGYNSSVQLYAPIYTKRQGKIEQEQVESVYDYTKPEYDWYHRPLAEGGVWLEPFFGKVARTLLAEFSTPFYETDPKTQEEKPLGVIYINYSLDELRDLITSLDLGKTGYGYLISQEGNFIYHPVKDVVEGKQNVFDLAAQLHSQEIETLARKGIAGEKGFIDFIEPVTGEAAWIFYQPITSTGWFFSVLVYQDEIAPISDSLKHKRLYLILVLICCLFFLSLIVFQVGKGNVKSFWAVSCCTCILLSIGIGYIWHLSLNEITYKKKDNIEIYSKTSLQSFLDKRTRIAKQSHQNLPIYIPTGIFIRTIKFEDANNILVTGNIWQKYYDGESDNIARGFITPEGITATDLGGVTEIYRYKKNNVEIIGWYFELYFRQKFDYSKYPFDTKNISIRILPKDFNHNIILIPDLDSYAIILPVAKPGLELNLSLPGWRIDKSFFSYNLNRYETNFGLEQFKENNIIPEFYFHVIITRKFLTVFITNFMPILVIALMTFTIQLIISQKNKEEETRKFTALEIVSVGGGLIFIILLEQLNLRNNIITSDLIYIEYFYFISYFMIILITINALLIALRVKLWLINYEDNLIPKLFYLPLFLMCLLIVTIMSFY